jgi:hypothetical protein
MNFVVKCVAVCLEPLSAAAAVVPPLPLVASDVALVERVVEKGIMTGVRRGSFPYLSAKAEFVDASFAAVWALQQERHAIYLPKTLRVPARGTPQMIDASMVNAAMSSGSR